MAISVESRKRLWGRSGGRCAICRDDLFDRTQSYDTIVGHEAHIIARSPGGPRREFLRPDTRIDDYSNLILLCSRHHTIVDAQPATWTVERLHEAKAEHEKWVHNLPPEQRPTRVLPGPDYWTQNLLPIKDGSELWRIVAGAHSYKFDHPTDCKSTELDYLAEVFDTVKDWAECASFMDSLSEERSAERALDKVVSDVLERSFILVGRRAMMIVTGGVLADSDWAQAEIQAWRPDQFLQAFLEQRDSTAT